MNFGPFASSYNGKPIIINKCASIYHNEVNHYFEIDIDISKFNHLMTFLKWRRKTALEIMKVLQFELGVLIEGKKDELPEQMLGCVNMNY